MEHVIFHSIMDHVQHHNTLIDNKHGFMSGFSKLISLIEDIFHAMVSGFQTDLILLDFSKAFDTVPHIPLLNKLQYCKIDNLGSNPGSLSAHSVLLWMVLILYKFQYYQAWLKELSWVHYCSYYTH